MKLSFYKLFPLLALCMFGCKQPKSGLWINNYIAPEKRTEFHALTKNVFAALKTGIDKESELLMSKELLDNRGHVPTMRNLTYYLNNNDYHLLEECYIVHLAKGEQTIKLGDHNIVYNAEAKEMYFAFYLPKTGTDKYMITIGYAKYSYGWRIARLGINNYTIMGKTNHDYYAEAQRDYDKGYLTDAVCQMQLAERCANPSQVWEYADQKQQDELYNKAIRECDAMHPYPIALKDVKTKPYIFRIENQSMPQGIFPDVYYLSKINLKDTAALRTENNDIIKVIGKVFPGIDKNKQFIIYTAFNEMPKGDKFVKSYDMMERLPLASR